MRVWFRSLLQNRSGSGLTWPRCDGGRLRRRHGGGLALDVAVDVGVWSVDVAVLVWFQGRGTGVMEFKKGLRVSLCTY